MAPASILRWALGGCSVVLPEILGRKEGPYVGIPLTCGSCLTIRSEK